jgi:hypothetical protein
MAMVSDERVDCGLVVTAMVHMYEVLVAEVLLDNLCGSLKVNAQQMFLRFEQDSDALLVEELIHLGLDGAPL